MIFCMASVRLNRLAVLASASTTAIVLPITTLHMIISPGCLGASPGTSRFSANAFDCLLKCPELFHLAFEVEASPIDHRGLRLRRGERTSGNTDNNPFTGPKGQLIVVEKLSFARRIRNQVLL